MGSKFFGRKRPYNRYSVLWYQKKLIEENYDFLTCRIVNNVLVCNGSLKVAECDEPYKIKIEYVAGHEPKSTILWPVIEPSREIHMYKDHSICLHYPPDMKWNEKVKIYLYTVPWISEWIIYYELYKVNGGKWEGKESPEHMTEADQNINVDIE